MASYLAKILSKSSSQQMDIKMFKAGQSNPTYYVKYGKTEMVLRKKPPGKLLRGAHQIDREYKVMNALYKVGFPVPRMLSYCKDQSLLGTEFFVMEFLPGRVVSQTMKGMKSSEKRSCVLSATETLAKLHSYKPSNIGLDGYGKTSGFCSRVLNTWSKQYMAAAHKEIPEMKELISWLGHQLPHIKDESSVIHGDYSLNNVMFHPTEGKVLAVLDWELSTIGHPYADFAYLCMMYHVPQEFFLLRDASQSDIEQLFKDIPTEEELVKYYCKLRSISYPIPNWNFHLALNFFKLASIVQGVYSRYLKGNASSPYAPIYEALILPLIQTALKQVTKSVFKIFLKLSIPISIHFSLVIVASTDMLGLPIQIRLVNLVVLITGEPGQNLDMTLSPSPKGKEVLEKVKRFLKENCEANEKVYHDYVMSQKDPFCVVPILEEIKIKAKQQGLWNLFLPDVSGLSNVDYAHIAEQLGKSHMNSEALNCSAPDTGNMEVLHMYGSDYQKQKWLQPLLDGKIRSAFCMTEPQVASSDATNMETTITRDGNSYVVNGRKWWSTGAANARCTFGIVMGRTGGLNTHKHKSHSMIVVPFDTPGVTRVRNLTVFGYDEAPSGHSEMLFENVRVPLENLILGEGRGFEIAQGRLGPGRIHHCMRSIGLAERCLSLLVERGMQRRPFGKRIVEHEVVQHKIAQCRIAIDQCRLLTLHAAHMMDQFGSKRARKEIAMIKVAAPKMLCQVIDEAIQVYGGAGVSDDFPLAKCYAMARTLRIADGPDEVHLSSIGKLEIRDQIMKSKL
uniref:Acyl-CoA dehydrogenase family member 11 n=1 Tax=Ciona intestinalis TaxID=7719 RepID=F6PNW9_CIOIN